MLLAVGWQNSTEEETGYFIATVENVCSTFSGCWEGKNGGAAPNIGVIPGMDDDDVVVVEDDEDVDDGGVVETRGR